MKTMIARCAAAMVFAAGASSVLAQAWPAKTIRWIVPWPPGGGADVLARILQPSLAEALGQTVVVDNRGGAAGNIGAEIAAKSPPDGYTIVFAYSGTHSINPHIYRRMPFKESDFAPLIWTASVPQVVVVHPSLPVKTPKDIIALAKSKPDQFTYGSSGNGAINHLAMELFKNMAGVNITHVPYKGAPQAVTDVIGGNGVHMMLNSIPPVIQHVKSGRVRLLGVSSARRSPQLPDVPTLSEAGVPGYELSTWFGMLVPTNTPKDIIARLHGALVKVTRAPETKTQFETLGYDVVGGTPEEFAAYIRGENEKYAKIVKLIGAKVD